MNYFRGTYEAAEAHYREAGRVADELGLAAEGAQICNNLGFVLFRLGRLAEAEQAFLRASRRTEPMAVWRSWSDRITAWQRPGGTERYEEARRYYGRALALATEIGDRTSVGTTHMHLGRCAALEGRFAEAKHEFTMALNALRKRGSGTAWPARTSTWRRCICSWGMWTRRSAAPTSASNWHDSIRMFAWSSRVASEGRCAEESGPWRRGGGV